LTSFYIVHEKLHGYVELVMICGFITMDIAMNKNVISNIIGWIHANNIVIETSIWKILRF
jgi:hypothetical protein